MILFCQILLTSCVFNKGDDNDNNESIDDNENNTDGDNENNTDGADDDDDNTEVNVDMNELAAIKVPERFKTPYTIDKAKLEAAKTAAVDKLLRLAEEANGAFPKTSSTDYQYVWGENNNWTAGMYTACYLMAYQLTGDRRFRDVVNQHVDSFIYREANRIGMGDHDVGFAFMPSCIGAYLVLGSEEAKAAAVRAVDYYYDTGYSKEGKFIIRAFSWNSFEGYRTMMDSMMNASLLFWAGKNLNNKDYSEAALNHTITTIDYLMRDDGSTFHHYQFDPETSKPLYGVTWQGYSDDSCWSRGQSWGVYGFSIAYSYTQNQKILDAQRDVTYYMLNHLPDDLVPYWDYVFTSGDEPRDTSASAIAICGMLDMAAMLPKGSAQRLVYESAAAQMMEVLIDNYTGDIGVEYDGLIHSVTHAKPQGHAIEECAPYADYFFLEALTRYLKSDFIRPW